MVPLVLNSKAHKNGIADIDQAALYGDRRHWGHSNFLDLVLVVRFVAVFPRCFFSLILSLSLSFYTYIYILFLHSSPICITFTVHLPCGCGSRNSALGAGYFCG